MLPDRIWKFFESGLVDEFVPFKNQDVVIDDKKTRIDDKKEKEGTLDKVDKPITDKPIIKEDKID